MRSDEINAVFHPSQLIPTTTTTTTTIPSSSPPLLLLCMTGAIDPSFMHHWRQGLSGAYCCVWNLISKYQTSSMLLLLAGYTSVCFPVSFFIFHLLFGFFETLPSASFVRMRQDWIFLHSIGVSMLSFVFFRIFWHYLKTHHYFSHVENRFVFNINSQLASYFKQSPTFYMKPYAAHVPQVSIARFFLDVPKLTITLLCYHIPSDDNNNMLIPTACEAIDTLRAKTTTSRFLNIIWCVGTPTTTTNPAKMHTLCKFFLDSGFSARISDDNDGCFLVCTWASYSDPPLFVLDTHDGSSSHSNNSTLYYTMVSFPIQFIQPSSSSSSPHTPTTATPPVIISSNTTTTTTTTTPKLLLSLFSHPSPPSYTFYSSHRAPPPKTKSIITKWFTKQMLRRLFFQRFTNNNPYHTFDNHLQNVPFS